MGLAGKPLIEAARLWNNCGLAKAALKQLELIEGVKVMSEGVVDQNYDPVMQDLQWIDMKSNFSKLYSDERSDLLKILFIGCQIQKFFRDFVLQNKPLNMFPASYLRTLYTKTQNPEQIIQICSDICVYT